MPAIEIRDVSKEYANASHPAVDHVSLAVEEGQFIVLLGPSGCGKTTLLKMVNRLHETTSGQIFVEGTEIHDISATELRRRIGYVIPATGLFPHMTIAENIGNTTFTQSSCILHRDIKATGRDLRGIVFSCVTWCRSCE